MKKKVLIFSGFYVPSVKGGGPIRSMKNLIDNLSNEIDFYIVTGDRDLGDSTPFSNVQTDIWTEVGKAKVYYTESSQLSWNKISNIMDSIEFDFLYLNSFFSYKHTIIPLILNKIKNKNKNKPTIIAPRGELSNGALKLKSIKKKIYITIAKFLGIYKHITWHATAQTEAMDIKMVFKKTKDIRVANNLTSNYKEIVFNKNLTKEVEKLKIVFLSRIHPKKNLKYAIKLLEEIKGEVSFNIYGPLEDKEYWEECKQTIEILPSNIEVNYKGLIKHESILKIFHENHIFLFPTLGENYGHVISEALIGGCPIIISDQTPWRNLEEDKVGWDINLNNIDKFIDSIQYCTDLDDKTYQKLSLNAFEYGKRVSNSKDDLKANLSLFEPRDSYN
ncbi:glycosyltransferase [Priestia megaterium]|uniref:glycosyltransferase n=1 Tax=Priestia megaterium TaxID=1404 RepID=UPI003000E7B0